MEREGLGKTVNKIAIEVIKHTEAIDKLVTDVSDLKEKSTRLIDGQDKMLTILNRLDQERLFTPLDNFISIRGEPLIE